MNSNPFVIQLKNLTVGYRSGKKVIPVLQNINVNLQKGEMVCLVGENGIGKSTLLRTVTGIQSTLEGRVIINDKNIEDFGIQELSKIISLVLTDRILAGNLKVDELVAMGRHPYTNWLGTLTTEDREKINWVIEISGIHDIRKKPIYELSDGQFQKVLIARALAQDGDIIILDEPTAHLDLPNKISILKLLKDLSDQTGKSILMATHELEFGFQMADRIWMALKNENFISGVPEDLMLNHTFEKLIQHDAVNFNLSNGRFSVNHELRWQCNLEGDPTAVFWTRNALHRNHWNIINEETSVKINVEKVKNHFQWSVSTGGKNIRCTNIEEVINSLKQSQNR